MLFQHTSFTHLFYAKFISSIRDMTRNLISVKLSSYPIFLAPSSQALASFYIFTTSGVATFLYFCSLFSVCCVYEIYDILTKIPSPRVQV